MNGSNGLAPLTSRWIEDQGFGRGQVDTFVREFGDRMELTRANLMRAATVGLHIGSWIAAIKLSEKDVAAYCLASFAAQEIYYKVSDQGSTAWTNFVRAKAAALADCLGIPPESEDEPPMITEPDPNVDKVRITALEAELAKVRDELGFMNDHCKAIDQHWATLHDLRLGVVRHALGLTSGTTVYEMATIIRDMRTGGNGNRWPVSSPII